MTLPLSGVTVVSFEQAVAAPFCSRHLGDLGARVIKVEQRAGGDFTRHYDDAVRGMASHFVWLNRNKESLTLDVKHPGAQQVLERLLARADVVMQNLAPGAAHRMGIGASDIVARFPRAIAVDISGYGTGGPYDEKRAYDLLIQAEGGVCSITGLPGSPAKAGPPVVDIGSGLYSLSGILAALYARERTGQGAAIQHQHVRRRGRVHGLRPAVHPAHRRGAPTQWHEHSHGRPLWCVPDERRADGRARDDQRSRVATAGHLHARSARPGRRSRDSPPTWSAAKRGPYWTR